MFRPDSYSVRMCCSMHAHVIRCPFPGAHGTCRATACIKPFFFVLLFRGGCGWDVWEIDWGCVGFALGWVGLRLRRRAILSPDLPCSPHATWSRHRRVHVLGVWGSCEGVGFLVVVVFILRRGGWVIVSSWCGVVVLWVLGVGCATR